MARLHHVLISFFALVVILTVGLVPAASAKTIHRQDVLGAHSATWNRFRDGHLYDLHTYVSDTIRDHHNCAYVVYELHVRRVWHTPITDIDPWIHVRRSPLGNGDYRVTTCDEHWNETEVFDLNAVGLFVASQYAQDVRFKVKTCEAIAHHKDRCVAYWTKTRRYS